MTNVQRIRPTEAAPPARSPERLQLAAAIGRKTAIDDRLSRIAAALPRAFDTIISARRDAEAAEAALAALQADEPRRLVAKMLGDADDGSPSVADAAATLAAADAALDTARATHAALREQQVAGETESTYASSNLKAAISAIVAASPEVSQLLGQHRATQRRLAALTAALRCLDPMLPPMSLRWDAIPAPDREAESAAAAPWQAALSALEIDADAALPAMPAIRPLLRDLAVPPRVPVEWIGRARALRSKIVAAHPPAEAGADRLIGPFRPRPGWTPMPTKAMLSRLAKRWRALPAFGRLRLVTKFDAGKLRIAELRLVPSRIEADSWSEDEPALAISLFSLALEPPNYAEKSVLIAAVGQHALARRFERGADRADGAVLRDLLAVAVAYPALARARGDFSVPAGGGRWIGAVGTADAVALVRTFVT